MHYMTVLNASKKENDTNYWLEIFYALAAIVTLQSAKTHFAGVKLFLVGGTFWTDLVHLKIFSIKKFIVCSSLFG